MPLPQPLTFLWCMNNSWWKSNGFLLMSSSNFYETIWHASFQGHGGFCSKSTKSVLLLLSCERCLVREDHRNHRPIRMHHFVRNTLALACNILRQEQIWSPILQPRNVTGTYYVSICQAVVGFESTKVHRLEKIAKGLADSKYNFLRAPIFHGEYFDKRPSWILVPACPFEKNSKLETKRSLPCFGRCRWFPWYGGCCILSYDVY